MLDVFHRRCSRCPILGIPWQNHINNELMKRAGMEDLSNIDRVRRLTLVEHILWLPPDRPASVAIQWTEAGEEEDVQGRPGNKHSWKIYRRCEPAGVVFAE